MTRVGTASPEPSGLPEPPPVGEGDVERARVRAQVRQRLFGGPPEPIRVGRFELLDRIGSGAMGVVYQARDPQLDRLVALKLLHPSTRGDAVDTRTKMLLREARAMAKLAHPNVVTVHEVGTFEGRVFLAMERISGGTLREWMEREQPSSAQRLAVLKEAGRGLAAAHAQGLVHRDFKLDNVLIGEDGRPRIGDFGLVRPAEPVDSQGPDAVPATRRGAVIGTPAYMAPEQLQGEPADARSDQFSFCVTLIECLSGERPFSAPSLSEMLEVIRAGVPRATLAALPPGVARVVARGLQVEPDARYPSLDVLLKDLERAGERGNRRWRVLGGVTVVGATALAAGVAALGPDARFGLRDTLAATAIAAMPGTQSFLPHVAVDITRLCVRETLASTQMVAHPPSHAFDGLAATAWTEAAEGDGTGQWLEARLRAGTWVSEVMVSGGWASTKRSHAIDLWAHNNSFRKMRVSWRGGESIAEFDRARDRGVRKRVAVGAQVDAIRFTAVEVDRGRFNDLCLDDVVIRGYCDTVP